MSDMIRSLADMPPDHLKLCLFRFHDEEPLHIRACIGGPARCWPSWYW
jgi:hypothetical protein